MNSDVRLLLSDVAAIGREVFRDTAFALSDASQTAAQNIRPASPATSETASKTAGADKGKGQDQGQNHEHQPQDISVQDVRDSMADIAGEVAAAARQSVSRKLVDNEDGTRDRLLSRLRQAVRQLAQQPDYATSASMVRRLLEQGLAAYARAVEDAVGDVVEGAAEGAVVGASDEADAALRSLWSLVSSFGDAEPWQQLAASFQRLHRRAAGEDGDGRQLEALVRQASDALQEMLTDPDFFFGHADDRLGDLKKTVQKLDGPAASSSASSPEPPISLRQELEALLSQAQTAFGSALHDRDVSALMATSGDIADLLWPGGQYAGPEMLEDAARVFLPRMVEAVQHIPIPRLEVATPDVDLLLENVVLQPGQTVNRSSFLPFRLHVQVRNDVDVRKGRFGTAASGVTTTASIAIDGLSAAAEDVGYVLRLHAGPLLQLADSGLVSFRLDERGVDVRLDLQVLRGSADAVLALRKTQVRIHEAAFRVRRSRVSWLAWLLAPAIRPLLRRTLERLLADTIAEHLRLLNRELVFARERLRAARIANPRDIGSLLRAVTARFVSSEGQHGAGADPDQSVRVGLKPSAEGPFAGVYAPGSLAKVWDEEAVLSRDRVREYKRDGWRNAVFDAAIAV